MDYVQGTNNDPNKFGTGKAGWKDRALPTVPKGTTVGGVDLNGLWEEIVKNLIEYAGLTPSAADLTQVRQAIELLGAQRLVVSNWFERSNPKNFSLIGITWGAGLFVAVGAADGIDAYVITSPNGITWTERANPKNVLLNAVAWNGSLFVAVGVADGTDAYVITSPDGIIWTERANPKSVVLDAVAWNGSLFVAVGGADGTDAYLITSLAI